MFAREIRKLFSYLCLTGVLVLLFGCCVANAQQKKQTSAPAPKASSTPASSTSKAGGTGTTASHGPTANSAHGPTTNSSHGPTTSSPHGPTTSNPHGATTSNPRVTATTPHATVTASRAGTRAATPAKGETVHTTAKGDKVVTRANGKPAEVHVASRNMDIHHSLTGRTRVVTTRPDGTRVVSERGGRAGYVEHSYSYQGRTYVQRTYVYNNVVYGRYYAPYYYRGVYVNYYAPAYYYPPAFYGWAYNPWAAPVAYSWGWAGNPWYGYYGYYFTPYPVYANASLWLTDYMISATLAAAYQAQANAAAAAQAQAAADAAALTPQVKDLIAAEVQRQIALENAEAQGGANGAPDPASSSVQRMLSDNTAHVFVAGSNIDVVDTGGSECALSEGDALQLSLPVQTNDTAVNLIVLASKGGPECRRGSMVAVNVTDLQDMQNHMRETIDQGMGEMQKKQGQGGLPSEPVSAQGAPVKANFVSTAPPPDPNAATEISQQSQQATQAENEALNQAPQPAGATQVATNPTTTPQPIPAPAAPPTEITQGETLEAVMAAKGSPQTVVDLGAKKIYVYRDMKITFKDGKVSDVN